MINKPSLDLLQNTIKSIQEISKMFYDIEIYKENGDYEYHGTKITFYSDIVIEVEIYYAFMNKSINVINKTNDKFILSLEDLYDWVDEQNKEIS